MKLNLDCVRQILFCVEDHTGFRKYCTFIDSSLEESEIIIGNDPAPIPSYQTELLEQFSEDELLYHINYCVEAELIYSIEPRDSYRIVITDLTVKGHGFLEDIRNNSNWKQITGIASKIGFASLKVISAIAEGVATAAINKQLGLS